MDRKSIEKIFAHIIETDFYKDENQEMHVIVETRYDTFDMPPSYFHLIEEEGFIQIEHYNGAMKLYFEDIISIDYFLDTIF